MLAVFGGSLQFGWALGSLNIPSKVNYNQFIVGVGRPVYRPKQAWVIKFSNANETHH